MSRHEAGWVPDTTPGYQGQHRAPEESEAKKRHKLCLRCDREHFRAYPENPGRICFVQNCECWCRP